MPDENTMRLVERPFIMEKPSGSVELFFIMRVQFLIYLVAKNN